MSNLLREIEALGQAIWIDNLNRDLLDEGTMARLVEEDGISGVTSNPTIFEKGMGGSDRYDDAFREVAEETDDPQAIFERLALGDVRDAADLLRPVFDRTEGQDGYVSFELPASLANAAEPIDRSASVASFFVSRVDTKVDKALEELGREELRGRAAVANAKLAYAAFRELFSGERWARLAAAGANVQRPLWASTSTKNPDYPDTLYVDELIGPDTVNTM